MCAQTKGGNSSVEDDFAEIMECLRGRFEGAIRTVQKRWDLHEISALSKERWMLHNILLDSPKSDWNE